MPAFYEAIHEIVRELMYADNFYIALYDDRREMINFAFYRDEVDLDVPDPAVWEPIGTGQAAGLTGYLLRAGQPMLLSREEYQQVVERGDAAFLGVTGTDWMGSAAAGRGSNDRRRRRPKLPRRPPPLAAGSRAPHVRSAAHRDRVDARPGNRGDAAAQRGARTGQRDRCRTRAAARIRRHHRSRR